MKTYKGYELIREISDGKIKENSKIKVRKNNKIIEVIEYKKGRLNWGKGGNFNTEYLCNNRVSFELIEDEIDIEKIEELNDTNYDAKILTEKEKEYYHNITRTRLNEVIKAVKELDKKMK